MSMPQPDFAFDPYGAQCLRDGCEWSTTAPLGAGITAWEQHDREAHQPPAEPNYAHSVVARLDAALPGEDPALLRLYALLVLTRGVDTTLADVHDAWALWRMDTRPDHPDLVRFDLLSPEVQEYDRPYRDAIVRVAREVNA